MTGLWGISKRYTYLLVNICVSGFGWRVQLSIVILLISTEARAEMPGADPWEGRSDRSG